MAIDPTDIDLSDYQRRLLAELAAQSGKPWPEVFSEALSQYRALRHEDTGESHESFYDAAQRLGLIGCIQGEPSDLSTNPAYLEGLGTL